MALYYERPTFHTEGDTEDVLFTLGVPARTFLKDDTLRYVTPSGSTTYKVKSVDYVVTEAVVNPAPMNSTIQPLPPEVFYGVEAVA